jgi:hypothetical protein
VIIVFLLGYNLTGSWGTKFCFSSIYLILIQCIYLLFFSLTNRLSCRQFSYM